MTLKEQNKVSYVYFILSVLVILIHSINNDTYFEKIFSIENGMGQFAVPLFFFVSGFLFFRTANTLYDVKRKLKKRVYTLLVPYLLWNLIYYFIRLLFTPGSGMSMLTLMDAAFNYTYNPAFWFMYQLILLNILSPVFFYILKEKKYISLFYIVIMLFIVFEKDIPYVNEDAIIYYFSGAIFSKLYNTSKVKFISRKYVLYLIIISIGAYLINRYLYKLIFVNYNFRTIFTLSIVIVRLLVSLTIFYMIDLFFNYEKTYEFMNHTFFLYAIHYIIVKAMIIVMRFVSIRFLPADLLEAIEILTFVMSPFVAIFINYHLTRFLNRRYRKAYILLSGDR